MILKVNLIIYSIVAVAVAYWPNVTSPARISSLILDRNESLTSTCPADSIIEREIGKTKDLLNKDYTFRPCGCGSSSWTTVVLLNSSIHPCPDGLFKWNITDPNTQQVITGCGLFTRLSPCPAGLKLSLIYDFYIQQLVKVCIPVNPPSVSLPVNGVEYSTVCGKILGHGWGLGFYESIVTNATIDDKYMTGVSLTHGPPGNRSHIWSFTSARCEQDTKDPESNCPCTNTDVQWQHQTPLFVGQDYFCDTYCRKVYYTNDGVERDRVAIDYSDVLWDGKGCGSTSSCCSFNTPPYFCKELNYTTNQDMEMRVLFPTVISFLEIYIK